jgi:predicted phosphoadenosine phosphosulfate sulfurtransferase
MDFNTQDFLDADTKSLGDIYTESTFGQNLDEIIEEGLWDRMKARVSGVKDAASASATHLKRAVGMDDGKRGKDVAKTYSSGKLTSLMSSHVQKLDKQLSDFVSDAVSLGAMEAEDAETLATNISNQIHALASKANKGKVISKSGKNWGTQ